MREIFKRSLPEKVHKGFLCFSINVKQIKKRQCCFIHYKHLFYVIFLKSMLEIYSYTCFLSFEKGNYLWNTRKNVCVEMSEVKWISGKKR
jgi:hypothetical protein